MAQYGRMEAEAVLRQGGLVLLPTLVLIRLGILLDARARPFLLGLLNVPLASDCDSGGGDGDGGDGKGDGGGGGGGDGDGGVPAPGTAQALVPPGRATQTREALAVLAAMPARGLVQEPELLRGVIQVLRFDIRRRAVADGGAARCCCLQMLHEVARLADGVAAVDECDEKVGGAEADKDEAEVRRLAGAALDKYGFKALAMRSLRECFRPDQSVRAGCKGAATRALALLQHLSPCLPVPEPVAPMPMNEDWKKTGLTFAVDLGIHTTGTEAAEPE